MEIAGVRCQEIRLAAVEFRTRANASARERARVEAEVLERIERLLQIESILELDSAEWQCPVREPRRVRKFADAEQPADEVRKSWNIGLDPIPNMTGLLEEKGLKVRTFSLPKRVSGFTCHVKRPDRRPDLPVIVVKDRFSLERRRLTLAHELAHRLIAAGHLSDADAEKAATLFAGAFLIPQGDLLREVGRHRNALGYKELVDLKPGDLDVLDGSTPCQGFSTAGKRKMDDGRNQLFREYVRLPQGLQPKVLVTENGSGMVKGKMKAIFAEIMRELKASGCHVEARLMIPPILYKWEASVNHLSFQRLGKAALRT